MTHQLSGIFPVPGQVHTPANQVWMPVPDGATVVADGFPGWPPDVPLWPPYQAAAPLCAWIEDDVSIRPFPVSEIMTTISGLRTLAPTGGGRDCAAAPSPLHPKRPPAP